MTSWTDKYMPKKLAEVVGQKRVTDFENWYKEWKKGGKAALLWGKTGSGKTAVVYALAKEKNLELIEINASDARNAQSIEETIGHSTKQMSLFNRKKIILIDEVDGISGRSDKGGVGALIKVVKESKFPVVLTANDAYNLKLRSLRNYCELIKFGSVHLNSMTKRLGEICEKEGIECERSLLKRIARETGGDLRSAINDLESLSRGKKKLEEKDLKVLGYRESKHDIFEVLKVIFKTSNIKNSIEIMRNVDKDPDEIFWWLEQNITTEYENPKEIAKAFNYLSVADLFRSRTRVRQNWRFKKYMIDIMCGGVSISKKEMYRKFSPYRPPKRLAMYGSTKTSRKQVKDICEKMGEQLHVSSRVIMKEYFPVFRLIFKNKAWKENIQKEFNLEKEDLKIITG
ncbi:MAG: replication factor C large subunit [Candidatus Aenigmarchaeota archaeon]|nr:replication factor C large subunit [Candidatus Aenigmarchaeota archaeon]